LYIPVANSQYPPGKTGMFGVVTLIPQTTTGNYLTVFGAGFSPPGVSTVNSSGEVRANAFVTQLIPGVSTEAIAVANGVAAHGAAHLVVDLYGYFVNN
jgi:hypothetical protein